MSAFIGAIGIIMFSGSKSQQFTVACRGTKVENSLADQANCMLDQIYTFEDLQKLYKHTK